MERSEVEINSGSGIKFYSLMLKLDQSLQVNLTSGAAGHLSQMVVVTW